MSFIKRDCLPADAEPQSKSKAHCPLVPAATELLDSGCEVWNGSEPVGGGGGGNGGRGVDNVVTSDCQAWRSAALIFCQSSMLLKNCSRSWGERLANF